MKIPQQYEQFNAKTLVVLTSGHEARFYCAYNGAIEEEADYALTLQEEEFDDKEGHFERRGHGQVYGSGSVAEPQEHTRYNEFLNDIAHTMSDSIGQKEIASFVVVSPKQVLPQLTKKLPTPVSQALRATVAGNVMKIPMETVLQKITHAVAYDKKPVQTLSEEAHDILEKGDD